MADNVAIRNASGTSVNAAADELGDGSFSPKVTLLDGTGSGTGISPATAGNQATIITALAHVEVGGVLANPAASTLTRPADTTAYAANDLVANNTTAGSVVVPSFTATRIATGSAVIRRARILTNKTSGMGSISFRLRFWTTAPTYTNGDNGAYSAATGAAGYLGSMDGTFEQFGDGAVAIAVPNAGSEIGLKLASGSTVYVDIETLSAFTPASSQTFIITPEIIQD